MVITIKDIIEELLTFDDLTLQIAFDATSLVDNKGVNGGHPNITGVETADGRGGQYILLKSDEI